MSLKGHFKIMNHVLLLSRRKLQFPSVSLNSPWDLGNSAGCRQIANFFWFSLLSPNGHMMMCIFTGGNVHVFEYIIDGPIPCNRKKGRTCLLVVLSLPMIVYFKVFFKWILDLCWLIENLWIFAVNFVCLHKYSYLSHKSFQETKSIIPFWLCNSKQKANLEQLF